LNLESQNDSIFFALGLLYALPRVSSMGSQSSKDDHCCEPDATLVRVSGSIRKMASHGVIAGTHIFTLLFDISSFGYPAFSFIRKILNKLP
jgi:hypothetical protein